MNIEADQYEKGNKFQIGYAAKLIENIQNNYKTSQIPIALDIGSGSGNVTELLYKTVYIKKLYGVDVDPDMIDFASANHANNGITFVHADIGKDIEHYWQLESLRGQVNLIFSNAALHWIDDTDCVARNIENLLSEQGQAFVSIGAFAETEYPLVNWLLNIDPVGIQEKWSRAFERNNLEVVDNQMITQVMNAMDDNYFKQNIFPLQVTFLKTKTFLRYCPDMFANWVIWAFNKIIGNNHPVYRDSDGRVKHDYKLILMYFRLIKR